MTEYMTPAEIRREQGKLAKKIDRFTPPSALIDFDRVDGELRITIPALPPSKNKWDRLPKTRVPLHTNVLQAMRRKNWYDPWSRWFADQFLCFGERVSFGEQRVEVEITLHFPDLRNRDTVQNYVGYPPLMDALVDTGIIRDDGRKWCRLTVSPDPVMDGTRQTVIVIRGI